MINIRMRIKMEFQIAWFIFLTIHCKFDSSHFVIHLVECFSRDLSGKILIEYYINCQQIICCAWIAGYCCLTTFDSLCFQTIINQDFCVKGFFYSRWNSLSKFTNGLSGYITCFIKFFLHRFRWTRKQKKEEEKNRAVKFHTLSFNLIDLNLNWEDRIFIKFRAMQAVYPI